MIHVPPPDQEDFDTLDALLAEALDGADQRRIALLTRMFMMTLDTSRDADVDRMRQDGAPPVYRA
ncbi:hypothetical protein ABS771_08505 [Methylobacterium brachiatum]|uniref:DUF2783 domain-containing protein n=1 Tax=Methylobacterium brachiatum TaxID=269660 RepID=A0ABV1QVN5_9HYPH